MPNDLLLVRHGESEGNLAVEAEKRGDLSLFTEEYLTTPGHRWRLTATGREQAALAGAWIATNVARTFDRYYVSPYVRTRETAALLGLRGARWTVNRALRERDWGDIGSRSRKEFEARPEFQLNARLKKQDPLYWAPPNGESIAVVSEDRVRNVLSTLHRECDGQRVVAVTHADTMWAFRLILERMTDEEFLDANADPRQKIRNCEVIHYSRLHPRTGLQAPRMSWVRHIRPVQRRQAWSMVATAWAPLVSPTYSNDDLRSGIRRVAPVLTAAEQTRAVTATSLST